MASLLETYNTTKWDFVAHELRVSYIANEREKERQLEMHWRKRLFKDDGVELMYRLIDSMFQDPEVRALRKAAVKHARFDNALKRIIRELSTVYRKPATRQLGNSSAQERYRRVIEATRQDEVFRRANEYLNLMNEVLLLFRVREEQRQRKPVIDVITPDVFWAIHDPNDKTKLVAVMVDQGFKGKAKPRYLVWSDTESFHLDDQARFIPESLEANPFERIPGVLCHKEPPEASLLDGTSGADLVAAHLSAWFVNVLLIKETKSVTRTVLWQGDLSTTPDGQPQDTEFDNVAGEEVQAQAFDRGVSLEQFMRTADHIIERAAANHGLSPDVLRHSGATSGYELDLRRIPIEERRAEQVMVWRPIEREFAEVQSLVLQQDLRELAFNTDGWGIDFSEVSRHLSEQEKYELRKVKRSMGHSNAFTEAMEDNPDFTEDAAKQFVLDNIDAHALFIELIRALNIPKDGDVENPGQSPEENGADNRDNDDDSASNDNAETAEAPVTFFAYELEGGVVTINELRKAKGLPPIADGHLTLPQLRAKNDDVYSRSTLTQSAGSAEKITGLDDGDSDTDAA